MLNKSKGNMFEWITHTWNPIKGKCSHDCSYCYMKHWGEQKPIRLSENEFKTNLGEDNFIFVGSSTDIFAQNVPKEWIERVLYKCSKNKNRYLFQTKNPARISHFNGAFTNLLVKNMRQVIVGTTIESNRYYKEFMRNSPKPSKRAEVMSRFLYPKIITIEPIIDFDLDIFSSMLKNINPEWISIGADSQNSNLPEPSEDKIKNLILELEKFTKIILKPNLKRLYKQSSLNNSNKNTEE